MGSNPTFGTKIIPKQKLPEINFEWTPRLAYAVGLLVTDGNLSKDGRHITMRSSEINLLNTFKECLGLNNKIGFTKGQRGYRVQFGDAQFYRWLVKIGLFPAKTYTIGEIDVPNKVFRDYFRGCLDGDGNIYTYIDKYNLYRGRQYTTQRLFIRIVSASRKHIVWLQNKINALTDISGAIIEKPPANERYVPIWELKFAKEESLRLINWIYYQPDVPCLKRKRDIAERAIKLIAKQKRREYTRI